MSSRPGGSRLSLSAYRPRPGREVELVAHFRSEVAAMRIRGHITSRPAPICRTSRGEYLVVIEWVTPTSVDEAHRDPVVLDIWKRKEALVEYIGPAALDGSDTPFVSYEVVEDA